MNDIHSRALFVLGLKERLRKLRTEATELANAIDRWDEGKVTFDDVLHELRDCLFVWASVTKSFQFEDAVYRNSWRDHEREATAKLERAIEDMQRFVEDIAGDGD